MHAAASIEALRNKSFENLTERFPLKNLFLAGQIFARLAVQTFVQSEDPCERHLTTLPPIPPGWPDWRIQAKCFIISKEIKNKLTRRPFCNAGVLLGLMVFVLPAKLPPCSIEVANFPLKKIAYGPWINCSLTISSTYLHSEGTLVKCVDQLSYTVYSHRDYTEFISLHN